ncbi:uncharacterized protein [Henckelia pumila]|uniref:uncharacterized protein n=1 Tax=Henckelia pumila TaxID=405737 RepID=UPI003C6DC3B1
MNQPEQTNAAQIPVTAPEHGQSSTSADVFGDANPMEKLLKIFQLFKPPTLQGTENSVDCNCFLYGNPAYVLFDTGASHTFISEHFVALHELPVEPLATVVSISSPLGRSIISVKSVRNCILQSEGHEIEVDCVVLGEEGFLIYAVNVLKTSPKLANLLVVSEFADVFPNEIPRLPPYREVYFSIELMPGDGISVDPSKVKAVISWQRPISVPEI